MSGASHHPGIPSPLITWAEQGKKINFTKKAYATLVEMILTADGVIHAQETEPTHATQTYADLPKKVLSFFQDELSENRLSDIRMETKAGMH